RDFHVTGVQTCALPILLKVELGTERYSGMGLRRFLGDWSHAEVLAFDLYNPDQEPLTMVVRVHDLEHELGDYALNDRFNTRLEIDRKSVVEGKRGAGSG